MDKQRQYNDLMNEGGDGYNPYIENETPPATAQEKMDRLLTIMAGTSTEDQRYTELKTEYNTIFEITHTQEWTIEAREIWNNEMRAKKAAGQKVDLWETEKRLGINHATLKNAIKHYKL